MIETLWHNGAWKDDESPIFNAHDRIRLGDGIFDTMLAVNGKLIHADKHWARLQNNASVLNLPIDFDFRATALELLKRSNLNATHIAINTIISRGPGQRGLLPSENTNIQIIMRASPTPTEFPEIRAILGQTVRRNEGSPLSQIKSCNYGDNILALQEAQNNNANEAIILNNAGNVTCATSSNIFIITNNNLYTPPLSDGVLNGTTRQVLMEEHPVEEKTLSPDDLLNAEYIFLTNSIRGAQPIIELNKQTFPQELPLGIHKNFYLQ